ncbi:MAG: hypothetical protein ACRDPR_14075 [Nocardioidaceae bacterium]
MSRLLARLAALLLVTLSMLVPAVPANADITGLKCRYFDNGTSYTSDNYEVCLAVKYRMARRSKLIYASFLENDSRDPATGTCSSKVTKTFRWGGSVTASVEAKAWIFAKVSGAVTASFDRTRTSEFSTSAQFTVRPGDRMYCYYVEVHERFMTRQCYANAYTQGRQCEPKVFIAPKREGWVISPDPMRF